MTNHHKGGQLKSNFVHPQGVNENSISDFVRPPPGRTKRVDWKRFTGKEVRFICTSLFVNDVCEQNFTNKIC